MKPAIAVDITARDKTAAGRRAAEQGFAGTAKKTAGFARDSGFGALEKQAKGFADLAKKGFGLDAARRDAAAAADQVGRLGAIAGAAVTKVTGFAAASSDMTGMLGALAKAGGIAGTVLAGVSALGAGVFIAGSKFADLGAGIGRTARTLGVSADDLQGARAAAERFGVQAETTDGALESLGDTLHSARFGRDNQALGVMRQLGVQMKLTKDGGVDVIATFYALADAIARIADPQTQKVVAGMFGLTGALPAIRQGGAALKGQAADFAKSGASLAPKDIAQASDVYFETKKVQQNQIGKLTKGVGLAALGPAQAELSAFSNGLGAATHVVAAAPKVFSDLVSSARTLVYEGFHPAEVGAKRLATAAEHAVAKLESLGWSHSQAVGMTANLVAESHLNKDQFGDNFAAFGIAQWHPDRQAAFKKWAGHDIRKSTFDEQLAFINFELTQGSEKAAGARLRAAGSPAEAASIVSRFYERPAATQAEAAHRSELATALAGQMASKVQVVVSFRNAPAGMVARAAGGKGVAVTAKVARSMDHAQ